MEKAELPGRDFSGEDRPGHSYHHLRHGGKMSSGNC